MNNDYIYTYMDDVEIEVEKSPGGVCLTIRPKEQKEDWAFPTWKKHLQFNTLEKLADFLQSCNGAYHTYRDSLVEQVE